MIYQLMILHFKILEMMIQSRIASNNKHCLYVTFYYRHGDNRLCFFLRH